MVHCTCRAPATTQPPAPPPAGPGLYQPRFHQRTRLFAIVRDHLDEFIRVYPERFAARFGPLRPEVEKGFRAFLRCDRQGWRSVGGATDGKEPTDPLQCPECGEPMKLVRLVGPGSAREKYRQLRPSLLYWGDRGVIRREPLPRPP